MIVISDTSPIYALLVLDKPQLLKMVFEEVIIPESVFSELQKLSQKGYKEALGLLIATLTVKKPQDSEKVKSLLVQIDLGEAEALVLAKELNANLVLMDEKAGRLVALEMGLPVKGIIGILLDAKQAGIIVAIKPLLNELMDKINFRISKNIYQKALQIANEQ